MLRYFLPSRALLPLVCWSLLLAGAPARAQDAGKISEILRKAEAAPKKTPAPASKPAKKKDPLPVFLLRDRGRIPAQPAFDAISVRTQYGILRIPREQLVTVRFATRVDPVLLEKATDLLARMESGNEAEEEAATTALVNLGARVLPALRQLAADTASGVRARTLEIIAKIEKTGKRRSSGRDAYKGTRDEIRTDLMTFRGEVLTEAFPLETRYGKLQLRAVDLESIRFKPDGKTSRVLDVAPRYQPAGTWLDTRLDVGKNKVLTIKSSGETSVGNWSLTSDPEGTSRYNSFKSSQGFPMLSLVGKIGKSGKPFKVGKKYRKRSKTAGRLYLAIQPFDYEPAGVDGHYKSMVSITDGP